MPEGLPQREAHTQCLLQRQLVSQAVIIVPISSTMANTEIATIDDTTNSAAYAPAIAPTVKNSSAVSTARTMLTQQPRRQHILLVVSSLTYIFHSSFKLYSGQARPISIIRKQGLVCYIGKSLHKFKHCAVAHIYIKFSCGFKRSVH